MKVSRELIDRAENFFATVYKQKETVQPGAQWKTGVMRQIRGFGAPDTGWTDWTGLEGKVWRLAAVTMLAALVITIYVASTGFTPLNKIAEVFMSFPSDFTASQALGF